MKITYWSDYACPYCYIGEASYGIHAVPFFVIGEYGISGAQTTERMKQTMLKVLGEEKLVKSAKAAQASGGMTCGPDGCELHY